MTARSLTLIVRLSALSLSSRVASRLDRAWSGSIIATFSRSCYLDLEGNITAVVAADLLNGPLNITVSLPPGQTLAGLRAGASVDVRSRVLEFSHGWSVDAAAAPLWDARLPPVVQTAEVGRRLPSIQALLDAEAPPESIARPDGRSPRAAEGMTLLGTGLQQRDLSVIETGARHLTGLGPGLTPAGDDVLAGALVAVAVFRPPHARSIREGIMGSVHGRTTRISEAYLDAAVDGEAGEAWHRLLAVLDRDEDAERGRDVDADLRTAIRRVLAFGETSGADMLGGFLLAADALLP